MKFGSLFSGVGGFDLGFERAGMTCAWQAENNKYALQVLANHWPNIYRYQDVRDVGRNSERVDLICGGFPCQDLSVAGKRAGLAGERSGLWFEFRRIIEELKPRWVVIENVPGLLSSNKGGDMAVLLGGLAQLGYWWAYRLLDSQYYGVAQRRRRVFIVANLGGATSPAKVLFEPESRDWNSAPRRETRKENPSVAGTLSANGGGTDRPAGNANELDFVIAGTLSSSAGDAIGRNANELTGYIPEIAHAITSGEGLRQKVDQDTFMAVPRTVNVRGGKEGGGKGYLESIESGMTLGGQPQWLYSLQNDGLTSQNANGSNYRDDGLAYTQNSIDRQSDALPVGVRRLTPVECERLQGFPDGWTEGQSDAQRYKMMGNAVTVDVIEWIGKRIMAND